MPRIKTTPTVTAALFLLRVYLVGMLLLILVKFVVESRHSGPKPEDVVPAAGSEGGEKAKLQ